MTLSVTSNKFRESILRHKIELTSWKIELLSRCDCDSFLRHIPEADCGRGGRPCEQTVNDLGAHAAQEDVPHPVRSDDAVAYVGTPFQRR